MELIIADHLVTEVFNKITGDDVSSGAGSASLGRITISQDYQDENGNWACEDGGLAELRLFDTNRPRLIICADAFAYGGIDRGYNGVSAVTCDTIGNTVSYRLNTLGSVLIHEYTHWTSLVVPPLRKGTEDNAYGITQCRALSGSAAALENADNYRWFANELFWTAYCGRSLADPGPGDDDYC